MEAFKPIYSSEMTVRPVELFYYPVFKGFKVTTNEEVQWKMVTYPVHHPELKPHMTEPCYCSEISPGFKRETVDCYLIVSSKPLRGSDCSNQKVRYS